ncbi:DegT/DnrJ/EryC1/StrS family aminotransferase [Roseivirga spongicola]|uniref:Aminotransferase DegT n=1 Tax=Roseivirga spongicola TaxID=333140 RepID=A0A150XHK8_9BACT|nr:DegT/DnrJ/EryC1/StrS aminotransferase family protein [Roseivirga spongicola]KYG78186.1 hypothetical protein AWW68_05310 [Roseivirga spongicola]WPZ11930.1 DegT/DnrJ/EryC1/StrS aminotransferase family protein [Roseivirga spongicola]
MIKYPIYQPSIGSREKELVNNCLDSSWISSRGEYVDLFEEKLCQIAGVKHAISMHNGTHPLHIACLLLGLDGESEVIMPVFSYVATANAVAYCGAKPIFVDITQDDWNIDVSKIEDQITSNTKAIIAVDIYGYPANYRALREIAQKYDIRIIADSAESIGAEYLGQNSGAFGELSTFSFFGNKTITTGEGGALLTDDDDFAEKARQLKNQGNSTTQRYYHDVLGYNYRMTNIQAAIGLAQLEKLDAILERKREVYKRYHTNLSQYVQFQVPKEHVNPSYWLVSFCLPHGVSRSGLEDFMSRKGIETRPFFTSMDDLPYFETGNFEQSKDISKRGVSIPSYPQLTNEEIDYISQCVIDFLSS